MPARHSARLLGVSCAVLSIPFLSACLPAFEYKKADVPLPDQYSLLTSVPASSGTAAEWWRMFKDPVLNDLAARALEENLQIAEAKERVQESQALARRAGNTVSGNATLEGNARSNTVDTANLDISLSLDPFGGRRSQANAALQRLEASRFELQNAKLSILSELMLAYVDLRFFQQTLNYRKLDLQSRQKSLSATNELLGMGAVTRLDQVRFQALVAEIEAEIPQIAANIARQENRIATLLGKTPGALDVDLRYPGRQPYLAAHAPLGVPADLLRVRPDIRAAERNYAAAVSDVNAAQAARYPSLSLSGNIVAPLEGGLGSTRVVGAGLVLPLFNQPGLAAQVDVNESRASQAYLQWRSLVLSAVSDVETALAAVDGSRRVVNAARKSLNLNVEALQLSQDLYDSSGSVTVIDLLDSERAVTSARSTVAQAIRTYSSDFISLYLALGVGVSESVSVETQN